MMKRYLWAAALLCAAAGSVRAQNTTTFGNIVAMGVPCAASNCVYYQLPPGTPWVNITMAGTWTGSVEIATTSAPNANYSNLNTVAWTVLETETTNGTWSASTSGALYLRARATSWSGGSARVDMASSTIGSPQYGPLFAGPVNGTATPGGLNAQVQYNNNGVLAGSAATLDAAGNLATPGTVAAAKAVVSGTAYANVAAIPGLFAVGDSICAGTGGYPSTSYGFEFRLSEYLGGFNENVCTSGQSITDEPIQMLNGGWTTPTVSGNATFLEEGGKNDATNCTAGSACDTNSQLALQAVVAMAGTNNQQAAAQGVADSTWATDGTYAACVDSYTSGGTLTFSNLATYGGPVYVLAQILNANGGTASVVIDGTSAGTFSASSGRRSNGTRASVFGYPFSVSTGTHTLVISVTSATSTSNIVSVCGVAAGESPDQMAVVGHPLAWIAETIPYQNAANQSWVDAINTMKQSVATTMAAQGFGVRYAPVADSPFTGNFNSTAYIGLQGPVATSSVTCASGVCTVQTSAQTFQAGSVAQLSGYATNTIFNSKQAVILSAGLSSSQFEINLPGVPDGTYTETASASVIDPSGTQCNRYGADDNVHPNQCGHNAIFRALKYAMNPGFAAQGTNLYLKSSSITGDYTMRASDATVQSVAMSGNHTVTLPNFGIGTVSKWFLFTHISGGTPSFAAGSGAVLENFPASLALNCSLLVHNISSLWYADAQYCAGGAAPALNFASKTVTTDYTLQSGDGLLAVSCASVCTITIPTGIGNGAIALVQTGGNTASLVAGSGATLVGLPSALSINKPLMIASTGGSFWYNLTAMFLGQKTISSSYTVDPGDNILNVSMGSPAAITFNNIGNMGPFILTKTAGNTATLTAGAGVTLNGFPGVLTTNQPLQVYALGNNWYNISAYTVTASASIASVSGLSTTWITTQGPTPYTTTTQTGLYRICGFGDITVAGTGAGTWQLSQTFVSDGHSFGSTKMGITMTNSTQWSNTGGGTTSTCQTAWIDSGTQVYWAVTPTGTITTAPTMRYSFSLEYLNP